MKLYAVVKSGPEFMNWYEDKAGIKQFEFFLSKEARDQRFDQLLEELRTTKDPIIGKKKYYINQETHFEDYYYCYRENPRPGQDSYMYTLLKSETDVVE